MNKHIVEVLKEYDFSLLKDMDMAILMGMR